MTPKRPDRTVQSATEALLLFKFALVNKSSFLHFHYDLLHLIMPCLLDLVTVWVVNELQNIKVYSGMY